MTNRSAHRFSLHGWHILIIAVLAIQSFNSAAIFAQDASPNGNKELQWKVPLHKSKITNPIPADEVSIALGKEIFSRECVSCHGATGKGDGSAANALSKKVSDLTNPKMWRQTDGALFYKTKIGRRPMPSYKELLMEDEIWHVVNYMRTLAPKGNELEQETDRRTRAPKKS